MAGDHRKRRCLEIFDVDLDRAMLDADRHTPRFSTAEMSLASDGQACHRGSRCELSWTWLLHLIFSWRPGGPPDTPYSVDPAF